MYNGYVESEEKVQARKARILAGYEKPQPKPSETVEIDRLGWALATERQNEGITAYDLLRVIR